MRTLRFLAFLSCILVGFGPVDAADMEYSSNFVVFAPSEPGENGKANLAQSVLAKAEQFRGEISKELLGEELPNGIGRTCINVSISSTKDEGLTWAKDDPERLFHNLYLTTGRDRALGSTLKHEIAHVVLATRFPDGERLPAWVEEGIAGRYDDPPRILHRRRTIERMSRERSWPDVRQVLTARSIASSDVIRYSCAGSLTRFLVQRGGLEKLYRFAQDGRDSGWDRAAREHYALKGVDGLQRAWQSWSATDQLAATH